LIDKQWWNAKISTKDWKPVIDVETADVPCTAQKCRNNIQLDEIAPVSIEQLDDTTVVVDFGTNLTGMLKMKLHNLNSGQKITIHYADFDGRAPEEAWRLGMERKGFSIYNQRDEFISAGDKEELFSNVFNYHGYRYALIEGLNYMPKKEDLAAIPVETEVPEVGSFSCSNDLYNRIHKMVPWKTYLFYNDTKLLETGYPYMKKYTALVKSVDWVKCNYESHYGNIISNWKIEANQFNWEVTIPANSTATVYVPGNNITEGGLPIEDAVGVTFIINEDGASVYKVEFGNYSFGSTLD
jgi:hypothetical protein